MKNPLLNHPPKSTESVIAIAGHPVHAMLVSFPVAFLLGGLGSDLLYWQSYDPFWARMSLWLIGTGFIVGCMAAAAGMLEFFMVKEIRRHITSWSHFVAAIMLLSIAAANWWMRILEPEQTLLPWGIFLSAVSAVSLIIASWFGGKLVFEHNVGTGNED